MKLAEQVCTLGQARRPFELGVSGVGVAFVYPSWPSLSHVKLLLQQEKGTVEVARDYDNAKWNGWITAFTVAELITAIGMAWFSRYDEEAFEQIEEDETEPAISKHPIGFEIGLSYHMPVGWVDFVHKPIAQGLAGLLIYLLETRSVTAEEVNARLSPQPVK